MSNLVDINGALVKGGIQIEIRDDGQVVWINCGTHCLVRICHIKGNLEVIDRREKER